ncbi:Hypothetical protein A7982_08475 [Minicystis rosea]|nr:Hypothetical protein A7982_08475 [Minicystis rosea]
MRPFRKAPALILATGLLAGLLAPGRAEADPSALPPSITYNYGENESARSAAMGGALRATGYGTTGIFQNPATIAAQRLYHIEASAQVTPETNRQVYGGTVVDSVTSRLCGSFSFVGGFADPSGIDRSFLDMRLALAFPITDRILIGLGGRYLKLTQSGLGPFGMSSVSGGLFDANSTDTPRGRMPMVNAVTWDAGLVIKPTDSFYIAAVGQNLTYTKNGILPLTVGGGIGYGSETFSIEADGIADIGSWDKPTARVGAGAEYVISGMVPVRAGYKFDQGGKLHTLSVGTGFIHPIFSVEATVKRTLSNPGATSMVFSIAYHLDSSGVTKPSQPVSETAQ